MSSVQSFPRERLGLFAMPAPFASACNAGNNENVRGQLIHFSSVQRNPRVASRGFEHGLEHGFENGQNNCSIMNWTCFMPLARNWQELA